MFKALMAVQWKWTKGAALLASIIGFGIPLASMEGTLGYPNAGETVLRMQGFGVAYTVLAGGVGLAFALFAWSPDHRGRHVYALALPVERSKYAAMRFGAGLLFLTLPTLGVLAGSTIAIAVFTIPAGLHAYPISLALRFFLASCVAFAIFFAISASTPKAAGMVLGVFACLVLMDFLLSAASVDFNLLGHVADFLFTGPGPLAVFTGRWMLIDA